MQLYSVPPYACSAFFSLASCYASDRLRLRGPFVIVSALISITGYAMYTAVRRPRSCTPACSCRSSAHTPSLRCSRRGCPTTSRRIISASRASLWLYQYQLGRYLVDVAVSNDRVPSVHPRNVHPARHGEHDHHRCCREHALPRARERPKAQGGRRRRRYTGRRGRQRQLQIHLIMLYVHRLYT